jgi:hypothetical protein
MSKVQRSAVPSSGNDSQGECWYDAELSRLRAELLLSGGAGVAAAESAYERAIAIAMSQGARLFHLRAAVGLARLRRSQGRRAAAHELLQPILAGFTGGLAIPDRREAESLLHELR